MNFVRTDSVSINQGVGQIDWDFAKRLNTIAVNQTSWHFLLYQLAYISSTHLYSGLSIHSEGNPGSLPLLAKEKMQGHNNMDLYVLPGNQ